MAKRAALTKSDIKTLVGFVRVLVSYGCAGVDQDPDDVTLCGKCAACEARVFLEKRGLLQ